ncbi:hypothetical protein ZOD2009_02910 [Haladaptatus paucihalophilus DX253]|uniref:Uncharacterized protein n=1 Tax=Haladaptatus paucihalophilus DX253 TaxID=797209 RepID=E7QNI9_HALPU|nr:hypothetical protein [Haladaptatus paucihalophilus]EFW94059.1 hypothetical protein ZOD2009_02910 [Haladaptatus paucihalophilus DX253]
MTKGDDDSGLGFTLPPMHLPPLSLPEQIRLVVPLFKLPERPERSSQVRVRTKYLVAALLLFDLLDAILAVGLGSPAPWLRALVGVGLTATLIGPASLLYLWEPLAVVFGVGWVTVVPSATLLLLTRVVRQFDLLGRRHPEQVDGDAERERKHPDEDEGGSDVSDTAAPEPDHAAQHDGRDDVDERDE